MILAVTQRRVAKTVPGVFLVLALLLAMPAAPSAQAISRVAVVTTTNIAYQVSGQLGSTPLAGWLSGTRDSTGIVTATLTTADATTSAPMVEMVSGWIVGSGSSALVLLAVTPMAGSRGSTWTMSGGATGTAGQWAGAVTKGSAPVGSWVLTPQTSVFSLYFGGKSAATSKDKVSIGGSISAGVTAGGWADGTYSSFDGSVTTVVHGWVNRGGDIAFTIPWGKAGVVAVIGTKSTLKVSRPRLSGAFIGPGVGDFGAWTATS